MMPRTTNGRDLSRLRENHCREKAREILRRFHVETPEAIDVESLVWHAARLKVEVGGLTSAEGRIVATAKGGKIRVAPTSNKGRHRFTDVSGGNWQLQSPVWQAKAVEARDQFHAVCKQLGLPVA